MTVFSGYTDSKGDQIFLSIFATVMDSFEKFIVENEAADTVRLVMVRREWPVPEDPFLADIDAKTLVVNTIEARRKLRKKLPEWVACTWLVYPSSLCAEQCSSSDTARYKAAIVKESLMNMLVQPLRRVRRPKIKW